MEKTLRVTGSGSINCPVDTTVNLSFNKVLPFYEQAIEKSVEDSNLVKSKILELGLTKENLKTLDFSISPSYESYKDKNGNYKNRFVGFEYIQTLQIKFKKDNEVLGKILRSLSKLDIGPKINLEFTIEDQEKAKNEALVKAIIDCKEKANLIAKTSGVILKEIQNIDYYWTNIEIQGREYGMCLNSARDCSLSSEPIDIDPEDIKLNDNVVIVWGIE